MRDIIKLALFFIAAAVFISTETGCGNSPNNSGNLTADNNSRSSEEAQTSKDPQNSGQKKSDASEFPPLKQAVAEATIKTIDGESFRIVDKKGKVLLLNLWATWCGPCKVEMPELVKLQNELGPKGFEVIGLDTDDDPVETVRKFASDMGLNYTMAWADLDMQRELTNISRSPGIPQSFLIDREGRLRGVFLGLADIPKLKETAYKVASE
jgi:thiol-disulfide isomerase/thioredoxin